MRCCTRFRTRRRIKVKNAGGKTTSGTFWLFACLKPQRRVLMNRIGFALFASALLVSSGIAAKDNDKQHLDPYVTGPVDESRLIQEVRHKLVMLPYYSVFDDLGFTVNGSTVTLVGAVTRPVLKDDAGKTVKDVEGVTN